jgi:hypothetical protein
MPAGGLVARREYFRSLPQAGCRVRLLLDWTPHYADEWTSEIRNAWSFDPLPS